MPPNLPFELELPLELEEDEDSVAGGEEAEEVVGVDAGVVATVVEAVVVGA